LAGSIKFIDRLRKAARLEPIKREIVLATGDEVVMWVTPLTAAERDRARKNARSDDANAFALQLLISKARDADGQPLFTPGDVAALRNEVRDEDLQKLMLAVLGGEDEEEDSDMKSTSEGFE